MTVISQLGLSKLPFFSKIIQLKKAAKTSYKALSLCFRPWTKRTKFNLFGGISKRINKFPTWRQQRSL